MPSALEDTFCINLSVSPLAVLPPRLLSLRFARPAPLLRALGPAERPGEGLWSAWLAEWGWTWRLATEAFEPEETLFGPWLQRGAWPEGFDARVMALAMALQLSVDGKAIAATEAVVDIQRVWRAVASMPQNALGEALALALVRADDSVFDFASVAPSWPHDVKTAVAERAAFHSTRSPSPIWLKAGYALIGSDGFGQLRTLAASLSDCELIHDEVLARTGPLPLAFEMAFWWEAVYCLTERHNYADAEAAQSRLQQHVKSLAQITGLIDPMWHHQQGRLMYYAGNFPGALAEFAREYDAGGSDLRIKAMLEREIANALSDLACLDAARRLAERSVETARTQGQQNELFKSLGRLAEIAVKQDEFDKAEALLQESLSIQRVQKERDTAQTETYLGHVALLAGRHDDAEERYRAAIEHGADTGSGPYITMGQMSLALATGNAVELERLWVQHRLSILNEWLAHATHVLPAATCILAAAAKLEPARQHVAQAVRGLIDGNYAVEAVMAMQTLPEAVREPLSAAAIQHLKGWQKALNSLPPLIRNIAGNLNGPGQIAEAVRTKRIDGAPWLRSAAYPISLALRG